MEHLGRPHGTYDGICVSVLLGADTHDLGDKGYRWTAVDQKLKKQLTDALDNDCAKLFNLW